MSLHIACYISSTSTSAACPPVSMQQLAVSPDTDRIHNGVIAQDTITVRNVLLGSYITFPGKFGCAHSAKLCTSQSCYDVVTKCPATSAAVAPVLKGECPGSGKGIESGWSFVADEGSEMSALPVPQQMLKAGLIKNKVVSVTECVPATIRIQLLCC